MRRLELRTIPNLCCHEHWGSIPSIGMSPEGFRADVECGAVPKRETALWDILLDPYFGGWITAAGFDFNAQAHKAGAEDFHDWAGRDPDAACRALQPALAAQRLTGAYQCIRRGILELYGIDVEGIDAQSVSEVNGRIARNYADVFTWYRAAMGEARFSGVVRPVHPEYYVRNDSKETAEQERAFTDTVMRIDPLLDLWREESPRREGLAKITGIIPRDAESWRAFLKALFDLAASRGALGIKQLQAYNRSLDFAPRKDEDVVWSGRLNPEQTNVFKDWVVNECCRLADEREWPHQIHVGTHNLAQSTPLPLSDLARRYPRMKIVMLHCWPFIDEAGWLAKHHANVFIDTCWQTILNPEFLRRSMTTWLNYVPANKIMCSQDATSIEMAVGSSLLVREILEETIASCSAGTGLSVSDMERTALAFLHNNAVALYGRGAPI